MIDIETQKALRDRFNPDGSKLRNLQLKTLEILDAVDAICKRNNIPYWLASGTLIGAVRHGGFIPWDDDLDIEILYSDRKRFVEACIRELPEKYVLQCNDTDHSYCLNILKIRDKNTQIHEMCKLGKDEYPVSYKYNGYFIDIFTVERSCRSLVNLSKIPMKFMLLAKYKWSCSPSVLRMMYLMCSVVYSVLRFLMYLNPSAKYYYHTYGSCFSSRRVKSEMVPTREILFEGKYFSAPNDADMYLKRIYGNYMSLPESAKQKPLHDTAMQ